MELLKICMDLLKSAGLFLAGVLKRVYWLLPFLILDPFDLAGRLFKVNYQPPQWLAWTLFGLGWFIAIVLTYHDLRTTKTKLERQLDQREKKKKTREFLGVFLQQGQELQRRCANEKEPPPDDDADRWADEVEEFLIKELDESYVSRFRSSAGVPLAVNSIFSIPHRQLWAGIRSRVYQIDQFIREIGS